MGSITSTSIAAKYADGVATDALFSTLYAELHRLAKRELWRAGPASLSVTTLLHEAYLDISARDNARFRSGPLHGDAARVMRGIIIDHVRNRSAIKRGGEFAITSLDSDYSRESRRCQGTLR